jgi:cyanophycin synthetase
MLLRESRENRPVGEDVFRPSVESAGAAKASVSGKKKRLMSIGGIRTLAGPNVYTHRSALVMRLNLGELSEKESREIPGFAERLLALLPGLCEHHCGKGYAGGFVERLREGTYFGHAVEHVALELTSLTGCAAYHCKTRYAGEPGVYNVVVEYCAEQATRYLLEIAVELVEALINGEQFSFKKSIEEAKRIAADTELGPSTRSIVEAAERRGIPWTRENDDSLVQLGYGKHLRLIQAAMTDGTSAIGMELTCDKDLTKARLEKFSIPVPKGEVVGTEAAAIAALHAVGAPVVVKPLDGQQGKGVSLNLSEPEEVATAFRVAREYSRDVIVESYFEGRNYRVLVVGYRMVAASERMPCHVRGDGAHTVAELIDIENRNPRRGEGHEKPLTKIKVNEVLKAFVEKQGMSLAHVPRDGERFMLCGGINLSTGGTARDVTDEVHPSVKSLCERAARAVGLDICGIDLVMPDIAAPPVEGSGGIIEINTAPGLRMHCFPSEGKARDVGARIVEMLYPADAPSRIPIISVTGTNGKTTVTRMIAHVLKESGLTVGMTTTDGIYLDGERIVEGDTTGPHSAKVILGDRVVEAAVLETARGGIVRRGLGYDWSDISVMTNIAADHIGQDGIESVEDILHIKALVAERVREGGTLILNADDEHLARLPEKEAVSRVKKNYVFFSLRRNNLLIQKHLDGGSTALFLKDGWIVEATGKAEQRIVEVASIPATMEGAAEFQVANALAAVAACRAYGVARETVASAMSGFGGDAVNPGRANLYRVGRGYVLVDYGHNPAAFAAVRRMVASWPSRRVTGIIGVPGDRDDQLIEEAGRVAARGFQRILIKEDKDLRGRERGEVAGLLRRAVNEESPGTECLVVPDEVEALRGELARMTDGQLVVVFYEKLEPVMKALADAGAVPAAVMSEPEFAVAATG